MSGPKSPVPLTTFSHELEAGVLINELRRRGIDARATGVTISGFRAEAPADVSVVVPAEQLDQARRVMLEFQEHPADIDWSQVDVGDEEGELEESPVRDYGILKSIVLAVIFIGVLWQVAVALLSL